MVEDVWFHVYGEVQEILVLHHACKDQGEEIACPLQGCRWADTGMAGGDLGFPGYGACSSG